MKRYIKNGEFYNGYVITGMRNVEVRQENGTIVKEQQEGPIFNPTEEQLLENGWEVYVEPELTVEQKFNKAKNTLKSTIKKYDSSDAVNQFTINGKQMWLTYSQRQQLKTSVEAYNATGVETVTKWFDGQEYTFPVDTWLNMLARLEVYAGEAKNVTDAHIAAVDSLNTIQEVEAFNYTAGYPQKLVF